MCKIEQYRAAKRDSDRLRCDVDQCLGNDTPRNDKHSVRVKFIKREKEDWSPMIFSIKASHGYYGSSSGYSDTSDIMGKYLERAIDAYKERLLNLAVELAEQDTEEARKMAEDEAREVLQITQGGD